MYKRYENESDEELIYRVCSDKETIGSWQDVANILNELLGTEYTESKFRKQFQAFQKMLSANKSKFVDSTAQLEEIELKTRELEREKVKFRDQRRSWSKQNYTDARFEEILDEIDERLRDFGKVDFEVKDHPILTGDNSMIVFLSDLHIGQCFSSFAGEFNSNIAKQRLNTYLNEIIDIAECNKVNKVYVCLLGDNISNSLHKTIEVSNKENVIDQLKLSIEYISSFCDELTNHFERVFLASASGNHSRLQPKDLAQHSERLDAFIAWDVCRTLEHKDNFTSLLHRSIDDGIAEINIEGKSYVLVHGDFDSNTKQGYLNLSSTIGFFPDYLCMGHRHYCMFDQNSKIIQSGSLAGSGDDYTIEKRLSGAASQAICICNKKGVKGFYPVILN